MTFLLVMLTTLSLLQQPADLVSVDRACRDVIRHQKLYTPVQVADCKLWFLETTLLAYYNDELQRAWKEYITAHNRWIRLWAKEHKQLDVRDMNAGLMKKIKEAKDEMLEAKQKVTRVLRRIVAADDALSEAMEKLP